MMFLLLLLFSPERRVYLDLDLWACEFLPVVARGEGEAARELERGERG